MNIYKLILTATVALLLSSCTESTQIWKEDQASPRLVSFNEIGLMSFDYGPFIAGVKVIEGNPSFSVKTLYKEGRVKSGFWSSTKGKWHFESPKDQWEYCQIIEGISIITEEGKEPITYQRGSSFILKPGFTGTWEVVEPTKKEYVIVTKIH